MRFGKSSEEYESEPKGSSTGDFIKYMKLGDNKLQILDEYENWVWYWEHYNPGGWPFPCMEDDREHCPGCQSKNEKMQKASRKVAFNAYDGQYTNVWKIPKTVAEKLKTRYDRLGTITDRSYVITQIKNDRGFYDYDIESDAKMVENNEVDAYRKTPGDLLAKAWNDAWGDAKTAAATTSAVAQAAVEDEVKTKIAAESKPQIEEDPPWAAEKTDEKADDNVFSEAELRSMTPAKLIKLCKIEGVGTVPDELTASADLIVDWMLEQVG